MDSAEITLQAITLPFLNLLRWNFFDDFLHEEDLIFFKSQFSEILYDDFLHRKGQNIWSAPNF